MTAQGCARPAAQGGRGPPRTLRGHLSGSPERPDRKAFVCLNHKAGSTTWNLALLRAGPHTRYHNLIVSPHRAGRAQL